MGCQLTDVSLFFTGPNPRCDTLGEDEKLGVSVSKEYPRTALLNETFSILSVYSGAWSF